MSHPQLKNLGKSLPNQRLSEGISSGEVDPGSDYEWNWIQWTKKVRPPLFINFLAQTRNLNRDSLKGTFLKPEVHLCLPKLSSSLRHVHIETRSVLKTANPQILDFQTDHLQVESPCKRKLQVEYAKELAYASCICKGTLRSKFVKMTSGSGSEQVDFCASAWSKDLLYSAFLLLVKCHSDSSAAAAHRSAEWSYLHRNTLCLTVRVAVGYKATRRLFWASSHLGVQATERSLHLDLPPLQEVVQLSASALCAGSLMWAISHKGKMKLDTAAINQEHIPHAAWLACIVLEGANRTLSLWKAVPCHVSPIWASCRSCIASTLTTPTTYTGMGQEDTSQHSCTSWLLLSDRKLIKISLGCRKKIKFQNVCQKASRA